MFAVHILLLSGAALFVSAQIPKARGVSKFNNLALMFGRLGEPISLLKDDKGEVVFDLPIEVMPVERYRKKVKKTLSKNKVRPVVTTFSTAQATAHVEIGGQGATVEFPETFSPEIGAVNVAANAGSTTTASIGDFTTKVEDAIREAKLLTRYEQFSPFIPQHRKMVKELIDVLLGTDDFLTASAICRERVNRFMFMYAMSVAMLHREDTAQMALPPLHTVFPEKYFDGAIFPHAREEANMVDREDRIPLEIPMAYTATDLDPEHRVAYFREDVGVNLHHWQWHLVYPHTGPESIVRKDRRGELFYYMHQQMVARYNFERFSNKLARAPRFLNWREPIAEGYFPKLDSQVASRVWPPRQADIVIQDLAREDFQLYLDVQEMERWRDRIFEAIHSGRVETVNNTFIDLDEVNGIDILGNIIESSDISVHPNLYGDMHNMGHMFISLSHDPDHRHLETFGVMGDPTTAMRDPVFYRWHAFVNDLFTAHKRTLTPYTEEQLNFPGMQVTEAAVLTRGARQPNQFLTFWQKSDIDISTGIDFVPGGPILVRVTHLQHEPFTYAIKVMNSGRPRTGTVRIFLAPRFDERGTQLSLRDQQRFFIEMDKFPFTFRSGPNTIQRLSTQSSVTIPYERTFRDLSAVPSDPEGQAQFYYCGCGWPQHMLVPKGSAEGFQAELFVMVSDFTQDVVNGPRIPNMCSDGHSYCGIRNQLYPDRRPMGFPFDRLPRQVDPEKPTTLEMFLTPNMIVTPVRIYFNDRVVATNNRTKLVI
ncbi:hypothetical protein R5R35_007603 [Gryllus longicercus]|uniref:Prophenoloxidase n=1 Tax=Gryllus longicercus TaxID=2509291 RepID=A0AAN9VTX0_9ORTH